MQIAIVNLLILGLLLFLFAAIARVRPDDRLRGWVAGWYYVLGHFACMLWSPTGSFAQKFQACLDVDMLALAGICFLFSSLLPRLGRKSALRKASILAVPTLLCINLVLVESQLFWLLCAVLLIRQIGVVVLSWHWLRDFPALCMAITLMCVSTTMWMFHALAQHNADIVVSALLAEVFALNAVAIWLADGHRGLGFKTLCAGFVAWSAMFPVSVMCDYLFPALNINPEFWNIPKLCVAFAMILLVNEEDSVATRELYDEYCLLFETNPHPMWIYDLETLSIVHVNHAALKTHGYTRDELSGKTVLDLVHPDQIPEVTRELLAPVTSNDTASRHVRKDGSVVPLDITVHDILFHGRRSRFALASDVTEREKLHSQLLYQAQHDPLTGLANRLLLQERFQQALTHAQRAGEKIAYLCIDIDRFKHINDTYGHHFGDLCLKRVSSMLSERLRAADTLARIGGEEFVVLLTGLKSRGSAEQVANDLLSVFHEPILIEGFKIRISISIGVALCPDHGVVEAGFWRDADSAMYLAKRSGGNRIAWASEALIQNSEEQTQLEAALRRGVEEDSFELYYQPVYDAKGKISALEALLRLKNPGLGLISPSKFIPIAEETGLIVPIGSWVIDAVCRQLVRWKSQGVPIVPVAVNVSGLQLMYSGFSSAFLSTLERFGIPPSMIHLELTESAVMRNVVEVSEEMRKLHRHGIRFFIDDFGTGYSSLGRLQTLPVSVLKIDRSFVEGLGAAESTFSIVEAIISMAHTLDLEVIAEGIEDEMQFHCLRQLGCDHMQGFLLSTPLPSAAIGGLLTASHFELPANVDTALPVFASQRSLRDADMVS